jgi:hypothetical protein
MTPAPKRSGLLPKLRFHPLCRLGRHKPEHYKLRASGEKWTTFIYICQRCNRVVGDSHAALSDVPKL